MTWQTPVFLFIALGAFAYASFKVKTLYQLMVSHQGKVPEVKEINTRLISSLLTVFGQTAVLQKKWIGILHATIFWGFIIITVGTLEQFVSTLYAPASFEFVGEPVYRGLIFLQDLFTFLVLVAVLLAAYRRFISKPKYLGQSSDANLILLFTGALMVSIFLMNAFHILALDLWFKDSMPFSKAIASLIGVELFSQDAMEVLGVSFKWVHMLIVLGFAMYIPSSKHLHVLAAAPNTFLKPLERGRGMSKMDFEDESIEQFGAAKITDLSWKDSLDYYSCTECGRCDEVCPAYNTDKPLSPKKLIHDLKLNLFKNKQAVLSKKYDEVTPVIDEKVTEDVIWACTSCRACEIACPVFIQHTDKIYDIRRNLVMMESKFPAEAQAVFKNMETNATPWAFSSSDRAKWAEGLDIKTVDEQSDMEVLLWVGCAGSYDDRNKKVLRAFVSLLNKAQIKFAILGEQEQCTGDAARRIGNEYLFQTLAQTNVETLNRHNVKKIVTACPHCFNTLKNEYGDFGGNYDVVHHSQMIAELIELGKITPSQSLGKKVTFHDSCYLGRWNGIYNEPRKMLKSIPDTEFVEIEDANHDKSMCCGAGGGRMWMEETIGKRINFTRTEQALKTNAEVVAASCPFCMTMITDGVKNKNMQESVKVKDIAELVNEATQ